MKFFIRIAIALTLVLAGSSASPALAFCGFYAGKADASLFNEASQVILARDGKRTVLSMLNDYKGPLNQFALIVPTPLILQPGQVRIADRSSFERLDAYSAPRLAEYKDDDPCQFNLIWGDEVTVDHTHWVNSAGSRQSISRGVKVEVRYTLEEYDIVGLSAKNSDGLETWLRENGYKVPKGTSEALKPYIRQGMKFFVAKVNLKEQLKTGYIRLRPLQFAFETEKFMLPMRLGMLNAAPDKQQDLIIYMLTRQGRVESSNYRTANLPTDMNLPPFIKPRFQEFYKAMFGNSARQEDYRVVFTEYVWNMAWCDPCAANPLNRDELRKAGVFWVDGDVDQGFALMQNPKLGKSITVDSAPEAAQPAVLTRLHVRYTPRSFPEDLMFTQTQDQQNWQARYVVHHPYTGNVSQCNEQVAKIECDSMCSQKVALFRQFVAKGVNASGRKLRSEYKDASETVHQEKCMESCRASKASLIEAVLKYYQHQLPERLKKEKETLASLTGWGAAEMDAMSRADIAAKPELQQPSKE